MSAVNHSRDDLRGTWGITPGYYLWPVTIKILLVIDGRIQLQKVEFGLWHVLDTLTTPFSW
jgi:hypothetical protein